MEKSWAEPGMKAWYKNLGKTAQKLVKKLGKSCAEAGIKAGKKLGKSCAAFPQLLYQLLFTRKIWAKACIKDGEELGRTWYGSWV